MAVFAVGVAVAVAAAVVVVGMNSGGGDSAGATADQPAGALPSGHPSVAADQGTTAPDAAGGTTIVKLERRRAKDPGNIAVLLALGDAYFMDQHLAQAERAYDDALAREPGNATAQVGLAMVWHARGDSKRAETALRSVLAAHPDNQDAHYSLAIVYFSSGRVADAKTQWEAAAHIDPTSTTGRRSQSFVDLLENQQSNSPEAN